LYVIAIIGQGILLGQRREIVDDEDILIVFLIRLLQLRGKSYRWRPAVEEFTLPIDGMPFSFATVRTGTPDSDELVSYLAVVRQFWLQKEPTRYSNIVAILINAARLLADSEMEDRLCALGREFRRHCNGR
jgi:hypothetical protein